MSINGVLSTANSGLLAAQAGLRTVSDNIANVNTPGYVRKEITQEQLVVAGQGQGARITGVKRITDQYLQLASLSAASEASRWGAVSSYMDTVQSLFGDPSSDSYFFSRLDDIYGAFATAANDPSSTLLRSQAVSGLDDFLKEAGRVNGQINQLAQTMDSRITDDVARANDLLSQIDKLNSDISRARLVGSDSTGAENIQAGLIDELSGLMSVRVQGRANGGVDIRSQEGVSLAGEGAATIVYNRMDATRGYLTATAADGQLTRPIGLASGEIKGLLELRDNRLPELTDQLGEFMSRAAERLNAAHNAASAVPAPATLSGRDTGLDLPTAVSGFSGVTTIAIVDASGVAQRTVAIDFTAGTMSVNGGAGAAFTPATFLAQLNASLGAQGSASFANGALSISASGGNGVAIDEGTSQKAGKAFSHFFGLNDLIRSSDITSWDTGLAATDPHGFTPGGQIQFRLAAADGRPLADIAVTMPAAGDMNSLLAALNDNVTGVGLYGQFSLGPTGALTFSGGAPYNANLSVIQDNTARGAGGPSLSQLFGLGRQVRAARASQFQVDSQTLGQPSRLAFAHLDLGVAPGSPSLRPGDGRGALALAESGDAVTGFQAAGSLGAVSMTVSRYATEFAASIGRNAANAESSKQSATAVRSEADARRQTVEGVNIDEELIRLSTYQQAFNASARMIQAATDLYDTLLSIV